jgi:hypothetical protein
MLGQAWLRTSKPTSDKLLDGSGLKDRCVRDSKPRFPLERQRFSKLHRTDDWLDGWKAVTHVSATRLRTHQAAEPLMPMLDPSQYSRQILQCGLMPEPKIRLQVNVAVAAEAEGGRVGEGFQVAVGTGVVEQAF